jgi:hypothetical protein
MYFVTRNVTFHQRLLNFYFKKYNRKWDPLKEIKVKLNVIWKGRLRKYIRMDRARIRVSKMMGYMP